MSRPTCVMSRPSTRMDPLSRSTMRNKAWARELLPAPVRPITPTFSPGLTSNERSFRTSGSSGE